MAALKHGTGAFVLIALVALLVYTNTLVGDFTFDDNFAVINNADVTNDANPVAGLFRHDFWGQDITSRQSHKSYRPITVLAFRWTRQAWSALARLAPGLGALIPRMPPVLPHQQQQQPEQGQEHLHQDTKAARPKGLHPFPFHALSVALHAVVSMMVLALAQHLFAKLEQLQGAEAAGGSGGTTAAATADKGHAGGPWLQQQQEAQAQQLTAWLQPVSRHRQLQALLAALLFALHPVHTEAVAGVVGCAELICALFSLPALLLYFMAVDGRSPAARQLQQQQRSTSNSSSSSSRSSTPPSARQHTRQQKLKATLSAALPAAPTAGLRELQRAEAWQHWLLVLAAAGLSLLAALSKEIGITIVGTMALYDALLAPHMLPTAPQRHPADSTSTSTSTTSSSKTTTTSSSRKSSASTSAGASGQQDTAWVCRRQVLRVLLLAVTGLFYIKLRSYVAVEQLVAIYRKVENPIPFASSLQTRVLSTGYLHARYAGLLLAPLQLSADWSFSCIPLVERLSDLRNVATAALYGCAALLAVLAQPWQLLLQLLAVGQQAIRPTANRAHPQSPAAAAVSRMRWRLLVVLGLVVAPFLPASNVFFYVGTFIGERLMYFPSIGFCLLLADLLVRPWPATATKQKQQQPPEQQPPEQHTEAATTSDKQQPEAAQQQDVPSGGAVRRLLLSLQLLLAAALLLGYGGRTLARNVDWWDEERLFLAALRVCPNSAKVQQNCGVLHRRYYNFDIAMRHFRRAQEIEPGYCEPSYWIALTTINQGNVPAGLAGMIASLSCKHTAGEALQMLNKLYLLMHNNSPNDPASLVAWGEVLAAPTVLRVADACSTLEDAALLAVSAGKSKKYFDKILNPCFEGIRHWEEGNVELDTLPGMVLQKFSGSLNTTLLRTCVGLRRQVYRQLTRQRDLKAPAVKAAVYKYVSKVESRHPACRTLQGGGSASLDTPDTTQLPSSHQKLLHRVQAADPEDPWLQLEWGMTLAAINPAKNTREAGMHLQVASAIFTHIHEQLTGKQQAGSTKANAFDHVTALDGSPLTAESSLKAAMLPLDKFRAVAAGSQQSEVRGQFCELLKRLCHLRLLAVMLAQQDASPGAVAGASKLESMKKVVEAKAAGRRCLTELSESAGCEQQAAALRQLVG